LMEPWSKTTKLESSVKAYDEELYKRKLTTISSSPMISETDTIILQNLKGVLKTKQKELEGQRKP
jgi:hypothetical protein